MKSITSKVNQEDKENARIDRSRSSNPADVEPGMADFNWDDDDGVGGAGGSSGGWGSSMGGGSDPFGSPSSSPFGQSSPFGPPSPSPFGGGFGGGFGGPFGQPPEQPKTDNSEDKFFETLGKIGKGFFTFSGEFVKSFKTFDVLNRMQTGKSILITGAIVAILGIILILLGFGSQLGFPMLVGGLISSGLGIPLFMWSYEDYTKNGAPAPQPNVFDIPDEEPSLFGNSDSDDDDDEEFNMFGDDDDDDFPLFDSGDDGLDFTAFNDTVEEEDLSGSMENVLENLDANKGMITRQYLYDNIVGCLQSHNPNFDKVRTIIDGSDEFDAWDAIIQNSANIFKGRGSEIEMPYLIDAKEKIFYYQLEIKRVNWLKNIDSFVQEIVNICRFDADTGITDTNIYGIGNTVGDRIYVKVMKGETAMVTVKDTYKAVENEVKNPKMFMPVVIGLDAEGNVVCKDFKDINSILITGMPRSGKSWLVTSILGQMAFYLKPSELNFYILDPKDQISDFKSMEIPHIKKFVSTDETILNELRNIVRVEGPRRKKIIGDAGFVNIWDFKKRNPDVDLPLLYVVIDEVITLAERMDRDIKDEFQGLLLELVSQLPALGIRIFMIPHVVKDQILKKSITDLIPCRISVRGDADHIERSVGVKNFKHKLSHQGDMAVRFNNDDTIFVHSAVIANSNEGNDDLFTFLLKFWTKLEPESLKGSLHQKREIERKMGSKETYKGSDITVSTASGQNKPFKVKESKPMLSEADITDLTKGLHSKKEEDEIELWD